MSGPSNSPFHVDGSRIGGSKATQRHNFGVAKAPSPNPQGAPPKKPRFIDPPPKRSLSQGRPSAPQLSQAKVLEIQDAVAPIIDALIYELEAVKVEADMVSGPTLRTEPELYKSIDEIGPYFTPQQVRSQVIIDSGAIENAATRILSGSVSSYLSEEQMASLEGVVSDAKALKNFVQQFDIEPITGAAGKLSQDHLTMHVAAILESVEEAERGIVSAEAGSVPVVEPMEKSFGLGGLLAVGALIAVGIIISDLI